MPILGLHLGPAHDTGAALVYEADGQLKCVAIAEARLSRAKHSRAFPALAIEACLGEIGIAPSELDAIVVEKRSPGFATTEVERVGDAVIERECDEEERGFFRRAAGVPVYAVNHHLAHAATAWHTTTWPDDRQPGAVLVVDGCGTTWSTPDADEPGMYTFARNPDMNALTERDEAGRAIWPIPRRAETQTIFRAQGRTITRELVSLQTGVAWMYAWATQILLGFGHMHAGKTMGLAAYGDPAAHGFEPFPEEILNGIDTDFAEHIFTRWDRGLRFRSRTTEPPTEAYFASAAAWAQQEFTRAVLHLAKLSLETTGADRLAMAGGAALNVVANRTIRDTLRADGSLNDMFVQPAASDEGLALGAALVGYYTILGGRLPFQRNQAFLGPRASLSADVALLDAGGQRLDQRALIERTADLLLDGKIIGWFQGRSEHGPRALGARSILCWPRPAWMKDHLNARVKHREGFRPFAPLALEEHAREVFDADFPVPYMLFNTFVGDNYKNLIPAVTHADGSARLQTVSTDEDPQLGPLTDLLMEIRARDGVGVLLNTSFNDNNEPIVETVSHAIDCARRTGLDALVCGDTLVELTAQPNAAPEPSAA